MLELAHTQVAFAVSPSLAAVFTSAEKFLCVVYQASAYRECLPAMTGWLQRILIFLKSFWVFYRILPFVQLLNPLGSLRRIVFTEQLPHSLSNRSFYFFNGCCER